MNEQQKQTVFDLPKVVAVGIASPVATILTSRFGVAGTLIGLALSAVILTALVDVLKVYLARAPATVAKVPRTVATKVPGGLRRTRLPWLNIRARLRAAFSRFSSLAAGPARRRSVLIGSVLAAGVSFVVGLSVVTALEVGVGKSLSCWAWDECPAGSSPTDDGRTSITSTLPSVLGGGQSVSSATPTGQPPSPQQPSPGGPGSPLQPESAPGSSLQPGSVPGSEQPVSPQPHQRWSPSGFPEEEAQQQSSPGGSEEDDGGRPGGGSGEDKQRSSTEGSGGAQQQEDQRNQPSSSSDRQTREPAIPSVPWST